MSEQAPVEGQGIEQQHVVDVLRYCLRQYAVANDLTTDQLRTAPIEGFVKWCLAYGQPMIDMETICNAEYGGDSQPAGTTINPKAVRYAWNSFQNPYLAVALLLPLWPWIADKRSPLDVKPLSLLLNLAIVFEDNTGVELSVSTPFDPSAKVSSGFLCSLLYQQLSVVIDRLSTAGVDELRKKNAVPLEVLQEENGEGEEEYGQ